eukprot:6638844-Pyramimonas_sp.AAC.1
MEELSSGVGVSPWRRFLCPGARLVAEWARRAEAVAWYRGALPVGGGGSKSGKLPGAKEARLWRRLTGGLGGRRETGRSTGGT